MTNPIQIPNISAFDGPHGVVQRRITSYGEITDDHIRAIHARMEELGLSRSASYLDGLTDAMLVRIAALEKNLMKEIKRREMSMSMPFPAATTKESLTVYPASPQLPGPSCITNPHDMVPSQWASAASAAGATPVEFDKPTTPAPASPVDDEATVTLLLRHGMRGGKFVPVELLNAIRRGEVPGLMMRELHDMYRSGAEATNAALQAEVERLRADASNHAADAESVRRERDAAIARAEKAERNCASVKLALDAERRMNDQNRCKLQENLDAAVARAEKAESYADGMERAGAEQAKRADQNQADMLEWRARAEKAEAEVREWESFDKAYPCKPLKTDKIGDAIRERDTARAAHAEALALLRRTADTSGFDTIQWDWWKSSRDAHLAKHGGGK